MVRVFVLALVALSLAVGPVMAQDGDAVRRMALAERLVAVSQGDNIRKVIDQQLQTQLAQLENAEPEHLDWMRINMPRLAMRMVEQLLPRITVLYAETFTAPELEAQIALFEGPLGRDIANKSVLLGVRQSVIMGELQQAFLTDLMSKFCSEFDCGTDQTAAKPATR